MKALNQPLVLIPFNISELSAGITSRFGENPPLITITSSFTIYRASCWCSTDEYLHINLREVERRVLKAKERVPLDIFIAAQFNIMNFSRRAQPILNLHCYMQRTSNPYHDKGTLSVGCLVTEPSHI